MKIVFISNYFNHHQQPFSDAIYNHIGSDYTFIETNMMPAARKKLGYEQDSYPDYVIPYAVYCTMPEKCTVLINDADIVIFGSAPAQLIEDRIKQNKIIFRYSERPLKKNNERWKYPLRLFSWRKHHPQSKNNYMLCASAYTSADFALFGLYRNKCYKWGYFTELKTYDDVDTLISGKKPASLLWVARFIDWKHPEVPVEIAKRLKADGYSFSLNMIGTGELEDTVKNRITVEGLDDCVHMLGSMKPEQVREHMEQSEIFLFTSDRNEGWGAVLNESMNSACAVVASHAIGSVPFLIDDSANGMIYKDGSIDELYFKIKWLLDHDEERRKIAKNAYRTMVEEWNAENAAVRFMTLAESILKGQKSPDLFENGVCSKAEILKDGWYRVIND